MSNSSVSYTKLKNGEWGVRVSGDKPNPGDAVTVTKKDRTTKTETILKVVWSDPAGRTHLCEIRQKETARNVCAECGRPGSLIEDLEDGLMKHYRCCDIPSE